MRIGVMLGGCLWLLSVGCEEKANDAQNAVSAAKAIMDMAQETKQASEAAEKAAAAAEAEARAQIPEGMDPKLAEEQVEMAKGLAAMKAMQEATATGPVVNWRQLGPFLPDALGELKATDKLKGSTSKAGGIKVTSVKRHYEGGGQNVRVEITDAAYSPMMRAPFAMAAMLEEDSTEGYRKGTKIDGHPAIQEWNEANKRSSVNLLVAKRFMVNVRVTKAAKDDAAVGIAKAIDLGKLAAVKGEAEEEGEGEAETKDEAKE